ncbi:MAG: zinc-ribbon domain-containing protein [Proteobacteria bacterium]|nr:zinc-ribbon domain-containing protein [Pseudomonadota bacterium]
MLAICEECSKKYNIDESKMKGTRARFSCQECGNIIVVVKQKSDSLGAESTFDSAGFSHESN